MSLLYSVGFVIAALFPGSRDGKLIQPVVASYEELFGVPFPTLRIVPIALSVLIVAAGAATGFAVGWLSAAGIGRFTKSDVDIGHWGAVCSIIGLVVSLVSLFF